MNINSVRKISPGQMPRADEWNAIVEHLQTAERRSLKNKPEILPRTRFYTEEAIPPYSLFAVKPGDSDDNSLCALYPVEKYNAANAADYLPNVYATNGRYAVTPGMFYGYVIDEFHDWVLAIPGVTANTETCGFCNAYYASIYGEGLYISGKAPFKRSETPTDLYYVRRAAPQSTPDVVLCRITGGEPQDGYLVTLYEDGTDQTVTGTGTLFFTELALGADVPAGAWVLGHFIKNREIGGNET